MPHAWSRALVPSTGAAAALALGGVCAVFVVMGAMGFGLWDVGDRSGGGAMALPRVPSANPPPARGIRAVRADTRAFAGPRSAAPARRRARRSGPAAVVARPVARRPVSAPSPQPASRRPAAQPAPSAAPQERAGSRSVVPDPAAVVKPALPHVPQVPRPAGSLPEAVRAVPGAVGRTVDGALGTAGQTAGAALDSAGQTADAAAGAVRQVEGPATAPLTGALPEPVRQAASDVVAGVLPAGAASP